MIKQQRLRWELYGNLLWLALGSSLIALFFVLVLTMGPPTVPPQSLLSEQHEALPPSPYEVTSPASRPPVAPEAEAGASFLHFFSAPHDPAYWQKTHLNYEPHHHPAWLSELIHFQEDSIELQLIRKRIGTKNYAGAEYQRRGRYSFGRYEVVMRAAPGSGTVSAMFTHTNDAFGHPHDEVDIEFLGKNLRQLQLNYFANGKPFGPFYVPLSFDASEEVHLYAFEWEPDEIRWFVDDKMVFRATQQDHPIPQSPSRIIIQLWSGTPKQYLWHGHPTFKDGTRAAYYCLSYQKRGDESGQCSDHFDPVMANSGNAHTFNP